MKLNPTANNVVVRPITQSEKTQAGVFLPAQLQKLLEEGVVEELGPKVDQSLFRTELKVGDRVVYSRYGGSWLKLAVEGDALGGDDERNRLIIEDRDLRCVPTA